MPRTNPAPPCVIEGCERLQHARGWCGTHYYRWLNNGDPIVKRTTRRPLRDDIGYHGAHVRVRSVRGAASAQTCGCGAPAAQWAYSHADPNEKHDDRGRVYSTDPDHYSAMCVSCHKIADLHRKATTA